jgi:Trypsin-like peptidase domain
MYINDDTLTKEIAERWQETSDQVANTVEAVATGDLGAANTQKEIDDRAARLGKRGVRLEAIIGEDDMVWLSFFSRGLTAARSVGRIVFPGHPSRPIGTGVLIGPALLLTNNHVIPEAADGTGMAVEFGYEYADDGSEPPPVPCGLDPTRAFFTDPDLDFTVIGVSDLDGASPGNRYGTVTLIAALGKVLKAECLNVVHHPGGERKRVSIRENRMVAEDDLWLRYTSDTKAGSSGSPVFNDQWEMVALHHGAIPAEDPQVPMAFVANEGARVSRIMRSLAAAALDEPTRSAVEEVLRRGGAR